MTTINGTIQQVKAQLAVSNPDWKFEVPEVSAAADFPVRFKRPGIGAEKDTRTKTDTRMIQPSLVELQRESTISKGPMGLGWV